MTPLDSQIFDRLWNPVRNILGYVFLSIQLIPQWKTDFFTRRRPSKIVPMSSSSHLVLTVLISTALPLRMILDAHMTIYTCHLLNRPNGLDGILMLASHILDELPDDLPEYVEFFSLFQKFCGALVQKVMNWKKVQQLSIHLFIIHHYINSPCRAQALERPRKRHDPEWQHLYVSSFLQSQYTAQTNLEHHRNQSNRSMMMKNQQGGRGGIRHKAKMETKRHSNSVHHFGVAIIVPDMNDVS